MKKIMLFFVACISCITVACDSDDDGTKGDDNKFPAPEVTFSLFYCRVECLGNSGFIQIRGFV